MLGSLFGSKQEDETPDRNPILEDKMPEITCLRSAADPTMATITLSAAPGLRKQKGKAKAWIIKYVPELNRLADRYLYTAETAWVSASATRQDEAAKQIRADFSKSKGAAFAAASRGHYEAAVILETGESKLSFPIRDLEPGGRYKVRVQVYCWKHPELFQRPTQEVTLEPSDKMAELKQQLVDARKANEAARKESKRGEQSFSTRRRAVTDAFPTLKRQLEERRAELEGEVRTAQQESAAHTASAAQLRHQEDQICKRLLDYGIDEGQSAVGPTPAAPAAAAAGGAAGEPLPQSATAPEKTRPWLSREGDTFAEVRVKPVTGASSYLFELREDGAGVAAGVSAALADWGVVANEFQKVPVDRFAEVGAQLEAGGGEKPAAVERVLCRDGADRTDALDAWAGQPAPALLIEGLKPGVCYSVRVAAVCVDAEGEVRRVAYPQRAFRTRTGAQHQEQADDGYVHSAEELQRLQEETASLMAALDRQQAEVQALEQRQQEAQALRVRGAQRECIDLVLAPQVEAVTAAQQAATAAKEATEALQARVEALEARLAAAAAAAETEQGADEGGQDGAAAGASD